MSTDLHTALRQAVAGAPVGEPDLQTVIDAGSRRLRRRAAFRVGGSALAVAAVAASIVVVSDRSDPEPSPARVVHLDLSGAADQDLDVLASVRTTWRDPENDLDHDRFEGLTADGLVLRSRYTRDGNAFELGLLDPETGRTDWLPRPPAYAETVVELTANRLVLLASVSPGRSDLLMFDRGSQTWTSTSIRPPAGIEVHVPFRLGFAADGRLYLGNNLEGESGPLQWWSYAVPEGGQGRPEPALAGAAVAWGEGVRATADNNGQVVLSSASGDRVLAEERPAGCTRPTEPDRADIPVTATLAGHRPVVTYLCGDELRPITLVYDPDSDATIQVDGAGIQTAGDDHVLLSTSEGKDRGLYLLDIERLTLARIGPENHDPQVDLSDDLVLSNQPGPIDDKAVYDVIWNVAQLPHRGD